jgi:4'-phosphopantetheinyl transferase
MLRQRVVPSSGQVLVVCAEPGAISPELARARYLALLSPVERAQHDRFRFDDDRHTYLIAHALVRSMLGGMLGLAPAALEFVIGEHGKPELAHTAREGVRFNLSHTKGLVACGVTQGDDLGVDVEQIERKLEIDSLARSVFSDDEQAALALIQGAARRERFFQHWTLKEAYVKAMGRGISLPLRSLHVRIAEASAPALEFRPPFEDDASAWQLATETLHGRHVLGVAVRRAGPFRIDIERVEP